MLLVLGKGHQEFAPRGQLVVLGPNQLPLRLHQRVGRDPLPGVLFLAGTHQLLRGLHPSPAMDERIALCHGPLVRLEQPKSRRPLPLLQFRAEGVQLAAGDAVAMQVLRRLVVVLLRHRVPLIVESPVGFVHAEPGQFDLGLVPEGLRHVVGPGVVERSVGRGLGRDQPQAIVDR